MATDASKGAGSADDALAEQAIVIHPEMTGSPELLQERSAGTGTLAVAGPGETGGRGTAEPFDADGPVPDAGPGAADPADEVVAERAAGLDAFRGIFLLAMNFAFSVPPAVFAGWMYHVQYPLGLEEHVLVPGVGWRDMLFGGFVFAMAAALPIAMGARLAKGKPYPEILWIALKRAWLLFVFALIIGHSNPFWTGDYTKRGNLIAVIGFLVLAALFTRPKATWDARRFKWFRRAAWAAAALLLFWGPSFYDETFSAVRRDGIIAAIAFCAFAGTAIWLFTRHNLIARLGVMALALVVKLAASVPGLTSSLWGASSWLFEPWWIELLLIVIPGTIAGDLLARWMRPGTRADALIHWSRARLIVLALIAISFLPIVLVGTYTRDVTVSALLVIALAIGGSLLCLPARTAREQALARLFWWGGFWLALGMLLEPFEGGIKKDPQTVSYLLVSAGLSGTILLATVIVADALSAGRRLLRPIVDVGQNPMLAYVVYMLFLNHILYLLNVGDFLSGNATEATIRGFLLTGVVMVAVWAASRARLYWRA